MALPFCHGASSRRSIETQDGLSPCEQSLAPAIRLFNEQEVITPCVST